MGLIETPAKKLAEAWVESPLYGHVAEAFAKRAWDEEKGHGSRIKRLADDMKLWVRCRNPIPDDSAPMEQFLFSLAIDAFDWRSVAEYVAEELDMPAPKKPAPKPRLR